MTTYVFLFLFNMVTLPLVSANQKKIFLFLNGLAIWMVMGLRGIYVGADTISYVSTYCSIGNTVIPHNFINWFFPQNVRFENGYLVLNKLLYSINPNPRFFLIIYSLICVACLLFMINKLKIDPIIGIVTYESMFMPFMMSGVRQALAISFCMVAFVFAVNRSLLKFLLFTYFALSMHVTAIVFLSVYLFKYFKDNQKMYVITFGIFGILIYEFENIFSSLSATVTETDTYSSFVQGNNTLGWTNIIMSVAVIFLILFLNHQIGPNGVFFKENSSLRHFSVYMLLFAAGFYLVSLKFSQISRISLYFLIGYYPILTNIFQKKNINILFKSMILIFLIAYFFVIQIFRPEWNGIIPYVWM